MLTLERKKEIVAEASESFKTSVAVVVAEYKGLSFTQIYNLRTQARELNIRFKVLKNTLAKRATQGTPYEAISDQFSGQVFYGFSYETPAALGRLLKAFIIKNPELKVKILSVEGDIFEPAQLNDVANLPTFDEAVVKVFMTLKSPVTRFYRTLNAPALRLVQVLNALQKQK